MMRDMDDEEKPQHSDNPICDVCQKPLVMVANRAFTTNIGTVREMTWCVHCGHLISVDVVGRQQTPIFDPTRKDGKILMV